MRVMQCLIKHNQLTTIKALMMKLNRDQRLVLLSQKDRQGKTALKLASSNPEVKALFAWLDMHDDRYHLVTPPEVVIFHSAESTPYLEDGIKGLQQAFSQLNIIPTMKSVLTKDSLKQTAQEIQSRPDISGLIVIIAAAGEGGAIQTGDGAVSLEEITHQMNAPNLHGKPKVKYDDS